MAVIINTSLKLRRYRPSDPHLFTRPETADYIGVSVSSLAHWSRKGLGPRPRMIGRSCYYHLSDIHEWTASRAGKNRGDK